VPEGTLSGRAGMSAGVSPNAANFLLRVPKEPDKYNFTVCWERRRLAGFCRRDGGAPGCAGSKNHAALGSPGLSH